MRFLLTLFLISLVPFAYAQDAVNTPLTAEPKHALAMHGDVKYGPGFTHLDYANPDAPKGGTLRQHVLGTFDSLNPFIVKGTPAAGLTFIRTSMLYASLMQNALDEPFSIYGVIAQSVEIPEDRSFITFNLRPQATWHDGQPITAEDVVWTFNTMIEKGSPFFKAYWGDVESVTAETERRVTFKFKGAGNLELPLIIAEMTILPKHYWEETGEAGNKIREFGTGSIEPPLGSGPYKVGAVDPGRGITYERFADWWGSELPFFKGQYNFDTVRFDYYRDSNVALEAFFADEYDVRLENTAKLWNSAYENEKTQSGVIIKEEIENTRPAGMQGFVFNTRRDIFKDPKVREALSYAFDFEWSNKQFAYGAYSRTNSFYENSELASSGLPSETELQILEPYRGDIPDEVFAIEYNPPVSDGTGNIRANLRIATKMLEEAGYVLGSDGVREKDGVRLEFEILDSNPLFERWVLPFIQNLERIGVKASFRIVDTAQYQNRLNDYDYDMVIAVFGQSQSPGNEQRDYWSSEKADLPGSRNLIGVKDPVVDALIEKIIHAPTREDLVTRVQALDRILLWNHYVIPMWHYPKWRIAYHNDIARPDSLSGISPAILSTWWSNEAAQ